MRIIVANSYAPWPVTKGLDRLIVNLLRGLSERHEVMLVTMALDREQISRLKEIESRRLTVRSILAPNKRSVMHKIFFKAKNIASSLLPGIPAEVSYAAPREYLRLVSETASNFGADLVLACYWHLYSLPEYLKDSKLALITMDLDFIVNESRIRYAKNIRAKIVSSIRAFEQRRIELEAYRRYHTIITVTSADAEVLERNAVAQGKSIHSLPLALDLEYFDNRPFERERGKVLLLGAFHADFNDDALRFFIRDIWPRILAIRPDAKLDVVGYGVKKAMISPAPQGVNFIGGVEDVRPYLGRSSLMVLPLRFGGGVRIRMMEAAAMGTPVVSTVVGVAGMGLVAGRDYLEAEDPEEFAGAVLHLLNDQNEAERIGLSARKWAESKISMTDYADRLDALLGKIALEKR